MPITAWQQFWTSAYGYAGKVPTVAVTILATWLLSRLAVRLAVGASRLVRADREVISLVTSAIKFIAWVLGFAAIFNALGLTQISLALGGSVALIGAALATGLNTIPQDLLAGIFLISDDDFEAGRRVKAANIEGRLNAINIRKTKIVDDSGALHTVPNRLIDQSTYTIYPENKDPQS